MRTTVSFLEYFTSFKKCILTLQIFSTSTVPLASMGLTCTQPYAGLLGLRLMVVGRINKAGRDRYLISDTLPGEGEKSFYGYNTPPLPPIPQLSRLIQT